MTQGIMQLTFESADHSHKEAIFSWLAQPHMIEFWDNGQDHKDDILNFMDGRKTPSSYAGGIFFYWVGLCDGMPYCMIMTHDEPDVPDLPSHYRPYLSKTGKTFSMDFGIGNPAYVGKGLAAPTLVAFMDYFAKNIEPQVKTFLIDPGLHNPRAIHVYAKAGFEKVCEYVQEKGYFKGQTGILMVKTR